MPPIGANGPPAATCSACGSAAAPLTRWPGAFVLESTAVSDVVGELDVTFAASDAV